MARTKTTPRSTLEKRFKCENCSYSTNRKANLKRHVKRHELMNDDELQQLDPGNLSDLLGDDEASSELTSDTDNSVVESDTVEVVGTEEKKVSAEEKKDDELVPEVKVNEEPKAASSSTDLELGRIVRKRTNPSPIAAPPRKVPPPRPEMPLPPARERVSAKDPINCVPMRVSRPSVPPRPSTSNAHVKMDQSVQTDRAQVRRRVVKWKCTKYREGDRDVEEIEYEENDFC